MKLYWIISLIIEFFGRLFRGLGTRIRFEARSESAIKAERDKIDRLKKKIKEIDFELQKTSIKLVQAKRSDDTAMANRLDDKRLYLMQKLRDCKRQLDDERRCASS